MRRLFVVLGILVVLGAGCTGGGDDDRPGARGDVVDLSDARLASALQPFDRCAELLEFAKEHARAQAERQWLGGAVGGRPEMFTADDVAGGGRVAGAGQAAVEAAGAPQTQAPGFSGTNVQEQGVDEPDLVKTDGKRLLVLRSNRLHVLDVTSGAPVSKGTLTLPARNGSPSEMLLAGDRLVLLGSSFGDAQPQRGWSGQEARVAVVDVADPANPKLVEELRLEGQYVEARLIDGVARIVIRSFPAHHPDIRSFDDTTVDDWLPNYEVDGRSRRLVECDEVSHPAEPASLEVVTVVTLDPADPKRGPTEAVLGAGDTVYSSATSLYVATQPRFQTSLGGRASVAETHVHRFDLSERDRARYVASGRVPGRVLNQFSLSEHGGRLRVATTDDRKSESSVTVLEQDGDQLVPVGSVGGLGRGEQIFAVRFLGDLGYVVTFRRTDPLYVVDLSDPKKPTVKGELKIPGYSAYLHPAEDGRLIGVGQDATLEGTVTGTQISLFDVSNPTDPRRLQSAAVPGASSEVEHEHHAFLWWPNADLAVVPVQSGFVSRPCPPGAVCAFDEMPTGFAGAVAFRVRDDGISEVGRISHPNGAVVRRSLVIGDSLYSVSEAGVMVNALDGLASRAWVPLQP